jgi:hypothetical protein
MGAACGVIDVLTAYDRRIDAEVLLHRTQATILDRGASLDDAGDRGRRLTRACTLSEAAFFS